MPRWTLSSSRWESTERRSGCNVADTQHFVTKGGDDPDSDAASARPTKRRRRQGLHVFPLRRIDPAAKRSLQSLDLPIGRLLGEVNPARKEGLAVVVGVDHPAVDVRRLACGPDVTRTRVIDVVALKGYLPSAIRALNEIDVRLADEHEGVIFLAGLELADSQVTVGAGEHDLKLPALLVFRFRLEVKGQNNELPERSSRSNSSSGIDQRNASGLIIGNDRDSNAIG